MNFRTGNIVNVNNTVGIIIGITPHKQYLVEYYSCESDNPNIEHGVYITQTSLFTEDNLCRSREVYKGYDYNYIAENKFLPCTRVKYNNTHELYTIQYVSLLRIPTPRGVQYIPLYELLNENTGKYIISLESNITSKIL